MQMLKITTNGKAIYYTIFQSKSKRFSHSDTQFHTQTQNETKSKVKVKLKVNSLKVNIYSRDFGLQNKD